MPIILQLYYKYYKFSVSGPSETSKYISQKLFWGTDSVVQEESYNQQIAAKGIAFQG